MTTSALSHTLGYDREHAARMTLPVGVASLAAAAGLSILGSNSTLEWVVEVVLQAAVAALLFGVVVPRGLRAESAGGRALVMAVIAVVLVPAFWTGLPMLLGAAAALLGYAGKRAAGRAGAGMAIGALVLGLLVVVAQVAIYVSDFISAAS
jgi:hypothetical protein